MRRGAVTPFGRDVNLPFVAFGSADCCVGPVGAAYIFALFGITKFEKKVDGFRRNIGIDEQ